MNIWPKMNTFIYIFLIICHFEWFVLADVVTRTHTMQTTGDGVSTIKISAAAQTVKANPAHNVLNTLIVSNSENAQSAVTLTGDMAATNFPISNIASELSAKMNEEMVDNFYKTTHIVLILVGCVFTFLGFAGIGGLWMMIRAWRKASGVLGTVETLQGKINILHGRLQEAFEIHKKAVLVAQDLETRLARIQKDGETFKQELQLDKSELVKALELLQVERYGINLHDGDLDCKAKASVALLHLSAREDELIRRRVIREFRCALEVSSSVFERLKDLADNDPCLCVRHEAQAAMQILKKDQNARSDDGL